MNSSSSYQALALEAREIWLAWNQSIKESVASDLPNGLTPEDKLLDLCGNYFLGHGRDLAGFYADSLDMMKKGAASSRDRQFIKVTTKRDETTGTCTDQ